MPRVRPHPEKLPFAYKPQEADELTRKVDRYFKDATVQRALRDIQHNTSSKFRNGVCSHRYYPKTEKRPTVTRYWDTAESLFKASNQTQKAIAIAGGYKGMIATSYACERLGLLLTHEEFRHDMQPVCTAEFEEPLEDSQQRIRVHRAMGLEIREVLTTGAYSEKPDALKKITHGIHLGFEQIGKPRIPNARLNRGYSHGASDDQLKDIWSYGDRNVFPKTLSDRIQGMDFRHRKAHEFGEQERDDVFSESPRRANSDIVWHTITTEVGGEGHIKRGAMPIFFSGLDTKLGGIGPIGPQGKTLDLQTCHGPEGNLAQQIQQTIDQIAELLYEYPKS